MAKPAIAPESEVIERAEKVPLYRDFRVMLDKEGKNIDACTVAIPDFMHAAVALACMQRGKHVYVEKPLSLCVAEGRRMVEAVRKHGRVCQVGIHRRSVPVCKEATDFVRRGGLGKVTAARAFHIQNEWPSGIGNPLDGNPPSDFDWNAWLGPAT